MIKVLLTSTAPAGATASMYIFCAYSQIATISTSPRTTSGHVPDELKRSKAVAITKPNNHTTIDDSRSICIASPNTLGDEEILDRFVRGFFGGWWFRVERVALRGLRKSMVRFNELKDVPVTSCIWSHDDLPTQYVLPVDSVLFGAFRVVDRQIAHSACLTLPEHDRSASYIDFVFGSENCPLAGVHRFSVSRCTNSRGNDMVTIEFAHTGCNPKENKPPSPVFLQTLHLWCAMVLFRKGIMEVVKASNSETS